MRGGVRLFIIYFPVVLVAGQVGANLLYFLDSGLYNGIAFYLNVMLGTNALFAVFLLLFTYSFRFCDVSRWAAVAEVLFAINYLVVQQDNLYNILFQVIVGLTAIMLTFSRYVRKFPNCRIARWVEYYRTFGRWLKAVIKEKSCKRGYERWEKDNIEKYSQRYGHANIHSEH